MNRNNNSDSRTTGRVVTTLAFLATFVFFQFAYPYHLIRREQMNLFLFDWDYIRQTYSGIGWLARFVTDFLEQFFHLPLAGPLTLSFLLTAIGVCTFRIGRCLVSEKLSSVVAMLVFFWSFMRETGNLYMTQYTVAVLLYLLIVLFILHFRNAMLLYMSLLPAILLGVWAIGSPVDSKYGKLWSLPSLEYERIIGLDAEVARENWDKVLELSEKDLYMVEASYCYNLAQAMKGNLGNRLFNHSQNADATLLLRIAPGQTVFTNCLAGEAWYQLGEMTVAEQSAIISLQASPKHTGTRYLVRLAKVNLITGQYAAANKYLNILSGTLFYRKWAISQMPENRETDIESGSPENRPELVKKDYVHHSYEMRTVLLSILEADPSNEIARNYLLCHDLLRYDLETFMEDYSHDMIDAHIYHEAVLIWLSQHDRLTEQNAAEFGISLKDIDRMNHFFPNSARYRDTYWNYYMNALMEEEP